MFFDTIYDPDTEEIAWKFMQQTGGENGNPTRVFPFSLRSFTADPSRMCEILNGKREEENPTQGEKKQVEFRKDMGQRVICSMEGRLEGGDAQMTFARAFRRPRNSRAKK